MVCSISPSNEAPRNRQRIRDRASRSNRRLSLALSRLDDRPPNRRFAHPGRRTPVTSQLPIAQRARHPRPFTPDGPPAAVSQTRCPLSFAVSPGYPNATRQRSIVRVVDARDSGEAARRASAPRDQTPGSGAGCRRSARRAAGTNMSDPHTPSRRPEPARSRSSCPQPTRSRSGPTTRDHFRSHPKREACACSIPASTTGSWRPPIGRRQRAPDDVALAERHRAYRPASARPDRLEEQSDRQRRRHRAIAYACKEQPAGRIDDDSFSMRAITWPSLTA